MKQVFRPRVIIPVVILALVSWKLALSIQNPQPKAEASSESKANQAARLNNLGVAYMNQQSFEKALKYFQDASAADPTREEPRLNQGIALLNLQKVADATPILQETIKRDPKNAKAWYNLGLLYKNSGEPAKSIEAFQKAVEIAPNDADAHYFLGLAFSQNGDNKSASAEFQKAIKLFPFHASAEFGLARSYQKLDNIDEAKVHLTRFQHLTQTKLGIPITLAYGEQGPLSLAATIGSGTQQAGDAIPVKFVDVAKPWGITGKSTSGPNRLAGRAACILDYDGDGRPDIFFTGFGVDGRSGLYHNLANGKFADVTKDVLPLTESPTACAAADFDNDSKVDLALAYSDRVALYHNEGAKLRDVTATAGLKAQGASGLLFLDYDHDGDVDLYVIGAESGAQMWRNNGNSTFTNVTSDTALNFEGSGTAAIASDVSNDRAVDIIATRTSGSPVVFTNPREGKWSAINPLSDSLNSATSITSLDFDKNGSIDFAITTSSAPGLVLLRNVEGRKFEPVTIPVSGWSRGVSVIAFDYDNDGFIDLVATGIDNNGKPGVKLFRNLGDSKFQDVTPQVALDKVSLTSEAYLASADLDGDGDTDLVITQKGTAPIVLRNDGGSQNNSLKLSLKGLADNKSALGTKVEVFAEDLWQKWEVHDGGGPGQSATDIIAGLGKRKQVDVVRLLWPTGVVQDEINVSITKPQQVVEIDRRGSSCPVLFAWDGRHYRFISDMIGSGVVGHWIAPGERNIPDPTEYLKVDGETLKLRNGRLSFRFMEPMEEVVYLDQFRLIAVDHPSEYDVYPNEYFASNPPFPDFNIVAADKGQVTLPAAARDDHGRNVLPHLIKRDHDYVSGFKLLSFSGYTEPHYLKLDLGKPYDGKTLRLLMHGFIEYFTATSMYAANQAGLDPIAPYVDALNADGKWIRAVSDIGFPAGLPRTSVADLTGKLPTGTTKIRVGTNLQIYWDQILIDRTSTPSEAHMEDVPLYSADLKFHGYPRDVERQTNAHGDHYYVYEQVSKTGPYARQTGAYTRLGNVKSLVEHTDDRFVVFGSGDVIELEFDPRKLPALSQGWTRDYFFFADGYEKDMDFYAADGLTVEPVPYSSMPRYPYPDSEGFPRDESGINYMLDYNTRFLTDKPTGLRSSYRFHQ